MKNLFKTGKLRLAAILTLCILLGITGTCVYAVSVMPEENIAVIEETTVVAEETTQELVPMMARACECTHTWVNKSYRGTCQICNQTTTVSYQECSKCGATKNRTISCGCNP